MSRSEDRNRPPLPHVMDVTFGIESPPVAQPRSRAPRFGGRPYVPSDHPVHEWKRLVRTAASIAYDAETPHYGPVVVGMQFLMPRPKYHGKKRGSTTEPHLGRPDADNLAKAVLDALTGLLWVDDQQVFCLSVVKLFVERSRSPGVVVDVELYHSGEPGENFEVN